MKIIFFDTETTGLDPKKCSIIQLAGTIWDTSTGQQEDFDYKIAPYTPDPWEENAIKIHKVTPEEAAKFPDSDLVLQQFKALMNKYINPYDRTDRFYLCGYNVSFDTDFLYNWFKLHNDPFLFTWIHFPALDVMQLMAWKMMGRRHELKNFKLVTIYEYLFGEQYDGAHGALADSNATKKVLMRIFEDGLSFDSRQKTNRGGGDN